MKQIQPAVGVFFKWETPTLSQNPDSDSTPLIFTILYQCKQEYLHFTYLMTQYVTTESQCTSQNCDCGNVICNCRWPWPTTFWHTFEWSSCSQTFTESGPVFIFSNFCWEFFYQSQVEHLLHSHRFFGQNFIFRAQHICLILRSNSK